MPESITVGIPCFNERDSIEAAVLDALEEVRRASDDFEVLVVDDASNDGTGGILDRLEREHAGVRVVRHESNRGIVGSFLTLYAETRKELLFMNAADRQWRMSEVHKMLEAMRRDRLDLVVGNRIDKQYTLWRKVISSSFRILCETLFHVPVWDPGSIKLMREPVRRIPVVSQGPFEQAERIIRAHDLGFRVGKVDVEHLPRTTGKAGGASWKNIVGSIRDLLRFRRARKRRPAPDTPGSDVPARRGR